MLASALFSLLPLLAALPLGQAATADQWRSRSVYQLLTDRFAPANEGDPCVVDGGKYCGGNWRSIMGKLDYIQGMGYDAIWISPTGLNIEGGTPYGEAYHGYWLTDPTRVNPHFGTDDDLKALSDALHDRGMYLMVDVAMNALASTQNDLSDSALASAEDGNLLFKHGDDYHSSCNIDYNDENSVHNCWLANDKVYLMDLNQDSQEVRDTLLDWAPKYVAQYGIDGFRLDAVKHMPKEWVHDFCEAAGVYCIGEVFNESAGGAGQYQGEGGIDGVLGFDMRRTLVDVFSDKSSKPISAIGKALDQSKQYPDPTLVGSFLENHDVPRFESLVSDKTKVQNAMVVNFLARGLPTVYYGLEQDMAHGGDDPYNREALWLYGNFATDTDNYKLIKTLNAVRAALGKADEGWYGLVAEQLETEGDDIALKRGSAVMVVTARGQVGSGSWTVSKAGFESGAKVIDLLSCDSVTAETDGAITVQFTSGQPFVFVDEQTAASSGFCDLGSTNSTSNSTSTSTSTSLSSASGRPSGGALIVSDASPAATGSASASASSGSSFAPSSTGAVVGRNSTGNGDSCNRKRNTPRRLEAF